MKKKLNIKNMLSVSILLVLVASISLFFINISFAANVATVIVETANLREEESIDSKILELVNKNESVEILEKKKEWSKVKYKGIVGYLKNDLISINKENEEEIKQEKPENNKEIKQEEIKQEEIKQIENKEEIKGKYKVKEETSIKVIPLISALDVEKIGKDTKVEVIDIINNWANIKINEKEGWVIFSKLEKIEETKKEEIKKEEIKKENEPIAKEEKVDKKISKKMYIASPTVNIRTNADRNSKLLMQIAINTQVEVIEEKNGWSKIKYDGKEGYVVSTLLSNKKSNTDRSLENSRKETKKEETKEVKKEETKQEETKQPTSNKGQNIANYAKKFIGTKYVRGGNSPSTGFDCSGFTSYVYRQFGIQLPRTAEAQAKVGKKVNKSQLQPGDLVCYKGHVAIYVGGGNVIHSPRPGKTVCIVPLENAGHGFIGGRRLV